MHGPNTRHWGPFYVTPKILASAGWDTNVNYSEADPFRDSAFTMTASAEALFPIGRRVRVIGNGYLTPNYFTTIESARSLDRSGSLLGEFDVGPLTPFGSIGKGRAKQRFSTEIDDRLWRDETNWAAGATVRLTRKLSFSGSWSDADYGYEEGVLANGTEVAQSLNRRRQTLTFDLGYHLTRRTDLTGSAEIIDDTFIGTPTQPLHDTARSYRYLGGVAFSPLARIQGQVLAGWRHYPAGRGGTAPSYDGPTLMVHLQVPFVGTGLGLNATRDIYYAVEQAPTASGNQRNSFVSSNYTATVGFDLPLSLLARILGGLERSDFLLPYVQDGIIYTRADNVWSAGGSLLRRFSSRFAIGGSVVHYWRVTNATGKNYGQTRYGATLEVYP